MNCLAILFFAAHTARDDRLAEPRYEENGDEVRMRWSLKECKDGRVIYDPAPALPPAPAYGQATLADVMPAVATQMGVSLPGAADVLGLPQARAYVLLLIDGLGWHQLNQHMSMLGYFPYLIGDGRPISAPVPSTTAVSLTTLGTGLAPGVHGIIGYSFRTGADKPLLNALKWPSEGPVPEDFQPHPPWFETLAAAGVRVASVGRKKFDKSGLTRAGLRGATYLPVADHANATERIERVLSIVGQPGPAFVYLYEGELDHVGHAAGVDSDKWRLTLERIDADIEQLRDALPDDVCLLVTGDHGMIDIPAGEHIIIEDDPELSAGIGTIAGEGRFRQLYCEQPEQAEEISRRWAAALGERAWVCTRDEAIAAGWFGNQVRPEIALRIGDILVAMRDGGAVMTRKNQRELKLIGQHGSLTPEEMQVPLLIDQGW